MVIHYSSLSQIIPNRIGLVLSGPTVVEWMGWSEGQEGRGYFWAGGWQVGGFFQGRFSRIFSWGRKGVGGSL